MCVNACCCDCPGESRMAARWLNVIYIIDRQTGDDDDNDYGRRRRALALCLLLFFYLFFYLVRAATTSTVSATSLYPPSLVLSPSRPRARSISLSLSLSAPSLSARNHNGLVQPANAPRPRPAVFWPRRTNLLGFFPNTIDELRTRPRVDLPMF